MRTARPLRVIFAGALAVVAVALSACGPQGERGDEARKTLEKGKSAIGGLREGLTFPVDGVDYIVLITRQLNPRDPEHRQYYHGPDPPPNHTLLGVFIRACNPGKSKRAQQSARSVTVVDTMENRFEPIPLPESNPFAYHPERLHPGECIPSHSSATFFGPTSGAMLLYELPLGALENRPLDLEIEGIYDVFEGQRQLAIVELDM